MENSENIRKTLLRLKKHLEGTLLPFYVVLFLIGFVEFAVLYLISLQSEPAQWTYITSFVVMGLLMFVFHFYMVRKPLYIRIDTYLKQISDSQLTGDELLKDGLLPDNRLLKKFFKHSIELRNAGMLRLYRGLLSLSITARPELFPEHSDIITILNSIRRK